MQITYDNWEQALWYVAEQARNRRLALFIDEFTYLLEVEPSIVGTLQKAWDHWLRDSNLLLGLSGSQMALMRKHVNAEGMLDYDGIAAQRDELKRYLGALAAACSSTRDNGVGGRLRLAWTSDPVILDTLAEVLFTAGDRSGAIQVIDEALVLTAGERYFREQRRRFTGDRAADDRPAPPTLPWSMRKQFIERFSRSFDPGVAI